MMGRHILLYTTTGAVLLGLCVLLGLKSHAQTRTDREDVSSAPRWTLVVEGERRAWPGSAPRVPLDSVSAVGERLLNRWQRKGHYYARLDSAVVDTTRRPPEVHLYARRGPRVEVAQIRIEGNESVSDEDLRRRLQTEVGTPLVPGQLEADIQALLDRYESAGHPLAQVRVDRAVIDSVARTRLRLTLEVKEGPSLWLKRVEPAGTARASSALLAHLAGLDEGAPLTDYDPETIRNRLSESDLFRSVETPEMTIGPDGGAVLRVPVEEAPPGSFDLVLGYLPASNSDGGGQVVGSGHLILEHLFGGGRRADLELDRRPGQSSLVDLALSDPYLFGLPLRVEGQFEGEQRDSTYNKRAFGAEIGYRFDGGLELVGSLHRQVVDPGFTGRRIQDGRQRIARSRALFYGMGLRYKSLDRAVNPRRGIRVDVHLERGENNRRFRRRTADGDTARISRSVRQERLRASLRTYVSLFDRHVIAAGGDASVLRSDEVDRSDLFRFGGAESLRGYEEDRFLGDVTARGLLEYRLQLDRRSYAYVFGDLGYVQRPALASTPARTSWRPGYGIGLQLSTEIGLLTTTYALNPEVTTPADGRVHFGLSVSL